MLIFVSLKYPATSKLYLHYQMIIVFVRHMLPSDYGDVEFQYMTMVNLVSYAAFSFDYWSSMATIVLCQFGTYLV